jgi:hypothetical protein
MRALNDVCGWIFSAASAEFNKRGVSSESKEFLSSAGEPSGMTGCTSKYLMDSIGKDSTLDTAKQK